MIIRGREADGRMDLGCDVVIIGSGASGSIAALELAQAGLDVIVIEEGPYHSPEEKRGFAVSEALFKLYRSQAATITVGPPSSPNISLTLGWGAGGSSVLTGGVCYRVPDNVVQTWVDKLGLAELAPDRMAPFYERIEQMLSVAPTPRKLWGKGNEKLAKGCEKLGYEVRTISRNMTSECRGCGRCNFVCPHGAKMSVDIAVLPKALDLGCRLVCDARATRLLFDSGAAVGVSGVLIDGLKKTSAEFSVRSRAVILAMGAIHTPAFMLKNRVGNRSKKLGRGMTLHPGFRTYGLFEDRLDANQAALQPIYIDRWMPELTLNAIYVPESIMIPTMPGFGTKHREYAMLRPYMAAFGCMVHDGPNGRVVPVPGPEPLIYYRLPEKEKNLAIRGLKLLAEIFFAAGAKKVLSAFHGLEVLENMDQVRAIVPDRIKGNQIECAAFHPLGTARMGIDPMSSVVDIWGRVHDVRGLYIMDGSVFPTALSVNSQLPVMAMAFRMAARLHQEDLGRLPR